jgi:hypothetical protein
MTLEIKLGKASGKTLCFAKHVLPSNVVIKNIFCTILLKILKTVFLLVTCNEVKNYFAAP